MEKPHLCLWSLCSSIRPLGGSGLNRLRPIRLGGSLSADSAQFRFNFAERLTDPDENFVEVVSCRAQRW